MQSIALLSLLGGLLVPAGIPRPALANGRYPSARFLTFGPGESSSVMGLQTTFGYVFSRDNGASWQLQCEEAIGYEATEVWDPPLVLTGDGAVAGLPLGVSRAGGQYCGFDRAASVPDTPIVDLATDRSGQKIAAAVGPLFEPNGLMLSDDAGVSWRNGWSVADFFILTVDIAPSGTNRLYVSGLLKGKGALLRSEDGGATFVETMSDFGTGTYVYISAVDPNNPDVLYVRIDLPGATALSRSDDGGVTFRELRRSHNRMTGFAISADGQTLWSASPGDLPDDGIYRSNDGGSTWQPMSGGLTPLCLRYHDGLLYMCASPEFDGFALACSSDGGQTFSPVLTWYDLKGPETCPAGSPGRDLCEAAWPALQSRLIPDGGMPPSGPRGCPRVPGDGGSTASAPDAGPPDVPADTAPGGSEAGMGPGGPAGGSQDAGMGQSGGGGCQCTTLNAREGAGMLAWPAVIGLVFASRLRLRRRRTAGKTHLKWHDAAA